MNNEIITLQKQAEDGLVIKKIQFEQVKTITVINGKNGFSKTNDIKRLGFKTVDEYIKHLVLLGYEIES